MTFDAFFTRVTGYARHDWQARLARDHVCRDRLVRIPTGFGKTAGVTLAWLWNRVQRRDDAWPRRLALCLPMRTLVEQTERAVADWLDRAELDPRPKVHVLLGGLSPSEWHLEPEREAILIGTQDMLLSRALNRGYGSGRARWPMEYGLLNVDSLWVMDEIQLMDVGLATSAQLQAFANADEQAGKLPRPRRTWWMSATLQRDWLSRARALVDAESIPLDRLETTEQTGTLWTVTKSIRVERVPVADDDKAEAWARIVAKTHETTRRGITLAVANTVRSAVSLHKALEKLQKVGELSDGVELRLVHSRFRGAERRRWAAEFLAREQCGAGKDRIIVATQVVEAGVDISADALVTEVAPWASLVQRFGRCARYGGTGQIVVIDRRHSDDSAAKIKAKDDEERGSKRDEADRKVALPYLLPEIEAAAVAIERLGGDAGPGALERFESAEGATDGRGLLPQLYPYDPRHVLTRRELDDLFDTGPDLTGADIDVSRFVREGDDRDVTVWWWPVPEGRSPHQRLRPAHDALCRVPVGDARTWLVAGQRGAADGQSSNDDPSDGVKKAPRAWVWSYVDGAWERLEDRHVYPGQTILVDAHAGGYDERLGFTGKPGTVRVDAQHARVMSAADAADLADEQEDLSAGIGDARRQYKTIATHGAEVAVEARRVGAAMLRERAMLQRALELAGIAHDIGKAHPAFAYAIRDRNGIPLETSLAKAPNGRWHAVRRMYDHSSLGRRPGFRHELASALALVELAWRVRPSHPALQGGREEMLDGTVGRDTANEDRIAGPRGLLADLVELDETTFNLVVYLVMCHHGKVRATLPMSARDQDNPDASGALPIRGVRDGDVLPALVLVDSVEGREFELPQVSLRLDVARLGLSKRYGPSWVERVLGLRDQLGSFLLAWLEALLRVADVRASQISIPRDARLPQDLVEVATLPNAPDCDAELREWIEETLACFATQSASERSRRMPKTARTPPRSNQRGGM